MFARLIPIIFICFAMLRAGSCAEAVPTPSFDGAHGLRSARRIDERNFRLGFGASFVPGIGAKGETYRIVSPDDTVFQHGVRASKAVAAKEPDATPPPGWHGTPFLRHSVTVTLPEPMKQGMHYWVEVLGVKNLATGGRAALWIIDMSDAEEKNAAEKNALGVRSLKLLAPFAVQINTGPGLDSARFDNHPEAIALTCPDDADFKTGRPAQSCGRRSRGDCLYPDGWPWGCFLQHELFAVFDKPLKQGHTYSLNLNATAPLICGEAGATLAVNDRATINPALKVNQIGYLPDAPAKYAYLGAWMGSLGAYDFAAVASKFEVRDAASYQTVLSGECKLRHSSGAKNEGAYKEDLSFEHVYELDFSALKEPGSYYVCVPGAGRSFDFKVAKDIYVEPFKVMMNGVLHQRCGIEMKAPYSDHYRPACHREHTELTDLVHASEADAFKNLPLHVIDPQKHDLFGGHHDAGDYNPRSHLDVAEHAFLLYELKPQSFPDGQLRIPEAGNGIPDLLDEARWALDLWVRLQEDDGGVRNGIESDGDPDMISPAEIDPKRDFAFAKDARGTLQFSAAAAQASLIWDKLKRPDDSKNFLNRAVRAWDWAEKHEAAKVPDDLVLAAIQLYRVTGEQKYLDAFGTHSVFNRMPNAKLEEWAKYNQRNASFYYAICTRAVDAALKDKIVKAFKDMANGWCAAGETLSYRFVKDPWAPISWGSGCHPKFLLALIQAQTLAPNPLYQKGIICSCDYALGCNPMNLVFTARLGQHSVWRPFHIYSRYSPNGPIAGIQCEGPSKQVGGEKGNGGMESWIGKMLFPTGPWPTLHTYTDIELIPAMHEGVVLDQMKSAMAYAFLLP